MEESELWMMNQNNHKNYLPSEDKNGATYGNYPDFIKEALGKYYEERVNKSWQGKHILKGKMPAENALIFSSNDYLHISRHPQLIQSQISAMQKYGNGQMQSAVFLSNHSQLLNDCEDQFSKFLNYPATLLAQSGWCANVGLIQALSKRQTPVYLDFYTHMSFWAGVKTTGAAPIPFKHNSIDSLCKRLERYGPGIIAVDSIYSTLGTISPLADYVQIAKDYNCLLIVDESHSLGTHGPQGRGLVAAAGLSEQVDIITASLAKAFCGRGGIISAKQHLIDYIRYSSLPAIFSSALVPHDLAGFSTSLDIILTEDWRREKLHTNAQYLRELLLEKGFNLGDCESQILPLMTGTEAQTIWLRNELEAKNIFGAVFCAPATPKNKNLIRLSVSAEHEKDQLVYVSECLAGMAKENPDLPLFQSTCHSV